MNKIVKRVRGTQIRLIAIYGLALAIGALLLDYLEAQFFLKRFSTEFYLLVLAALFTAVGIWMGHRLTRRVPAAAEINKSALDYLGISERERDVLTLLAAGHSNQEIADQLHVSTNTVKTHLKNLYQKLEVSRRGQAVEKARTLQLVT